MTLTSLQALTWGTVTGAVISALLLASGESGLPDPSSSKRAKPATQDATQVQVANAKRPAPAPNDAKPAVAR